MYIRVCVYIYLIHTVLKLDFFHVTVEIMGIFPFVSTYKTTFFYNLGIVDI